MKILLPYFLSALTILTMLMAGGKNKKTWLLGLLNQALWLYWIILVQAWGLLPMNIALWIVYARNHLKWNRPEKENKSPFTPLNTKT